MILERMNEDICLLTLSEDQLRIFQACIRESFAELDIRSFPSRIGFSSEIVSRVGDELKELMEKEGVNF